MWLGLSSLITVVWDVAWIIESYYCRLGCGLDYRVLLLSSGMWLGLSSLIAVVWDVTCIIKSYYCRLGCGFL